MIYNKEEFLKGLISGLIIQSSIPGLDDFIYIKNNDGTYTIVEWKGTYLGKPSTYCVIPDNPLIILNLNQIVQE